MDSEQACNPESSIIDPFDPKPDVEDPHEDEETVLRRRNPLRYMRQGNIKYTDVVYGATFKITVKTMRCSELNEARCVSEDGPRAILSWSNPFVTFEVLDEFTLEDLELTGYESLGKGCNGDYCTW